MPKISRKATRNSIRGDLHQQLKRQKKHEKYWYDLVFDYLALWDVKEMYIKDIQKNGVMVAWDNGKQSGVKKNDAAVELVKINKRMTELLAVLNVLNAEIDTEQDVDVGDDDV